MVSNGGFGIDFPSDCPDGRGPTGTNERAFQLALEAEVSGVSFPFRSDELPETLVVLDVVQFCYSHIAIPEQGSYHGFFDHYHLSFDRAQGRSEFRDNMERIFARNGIIYELTEDGTMARIAAPVLREVLAEEVFATGDAKLDELLTIARQKFLNPDPKVRREGLDKLWDAWERLKTIEGGGKKASATALLDKAASEKTFREVLEEEAKALTSVGNSFHIRHSETKQIELENDYQADYLFHRMFAIIWLLVRSR